MSLGIACSCQHVQNYLDGNRTVMQGENVCIVGGRCVPTLYAEWDLETPISQKLFDRERTWGKW